MANQFQQFCIIKFNHIIVQRSIGDFTIIISVESR